MGVEGKSNFRSMTNLVKEIKDKWRLGAFAILAVVLMVWGGSQLGSSSFTLSSYLFIVGGAFVAVVLIVRLVLHAPSPVPLVEEPTSELTAWTQSQEDYGFFVKRHRVEVRFLEWDETCHREVYEKYFSVSPTQNGDIKFDIISGSSTPEAIQVHHTHPYETLPEDDGFHIRTRATLKSARKDHLVRLLEKSTRNQVSNFSEETHAKDESPNEVRAHPRLRLLDVVDSNKWYVVIHVLYPTETLSFKADLLGPHRAEPTSLQVYEFTDASAFTDESSFEVEKPVPFGEKDGNLQIILWEKKYVKASTNFVLFWKWEAGKSPS